MTISKALRTGYYTALSGVVSVPVFDTYAPTHDEFKNPINPPYILLTSQIHSQRLVKKCKIYDSSILVDVVTKYLDPDGYSQAEDIAEEVENIINPEGGNDIIIPQYQVIDTWKGEDSQLSSKSEQFYIYRQLLRYNHLIGKH